MKKIIEIEQLKQIQLSILDFVNLFCKENNIRYSLCGGSLIGAIRHKGYIPWDDDIDIMMPRPDYDKFLELFNSKNADSNYRVINYLTDKDFYQPFSKIVDTSTVLIEAFERKINGLGVNIDVFVIDGLPNDSEKRNQYWKKMLKLRNLATCLYQKEHKKEHGIKKIIRKIFYYLFKLLPGNFFAKRFDKIAKKNNFEESDIIANSIFGYGKKEEMPGNLFDELVDVDFEGRKYKSVKDYNTYLSNIFGDYMQLPPKEMQVAKHDFEAYYK